MFDKLPSDERDQGWLKCVESTHALTSPNAVHHLVNLSNTKFISDERDQGWLKCVESTHALTSPNAVHHLVNLSNTKFITYIYTSFYHYFTEIYVSFFVLIFSKCQFRTFSPVSFRRLTGPLIHAKQNNHTTTKNIVLIFNQVF